MNKPMFVFISGLFLLLTPCLVLKGQWTQTNGPHSGSEVYALISHKGYLIASVKVNAYTFGIYRSSSGGISWEHIADRIEKKKILVMEEHNGLLYGGTPNGLHISTDGGIQWTAVGGLPEAYVHTVQSVLKDGGQQILYAGYSAEGVYRSIDGGTTWTERSYGLGNKHVHTLLFDEGLVLAGTQEGIFRSTDGGEHWSNSSTGIEGLTIWRLLAVPGTPDGTVFLAGSYDYGMYRSTDRGLSWVHIDGGFPLYKVSSMVFDGSYTYAGTEYQGAYRSGDAGCTWTKIDNGLESSFVTQFHIERRDQEPDRMFAATSRGAYTTTNAGLHWSARNTGFPMQFIQTFTTHEGVLYVGNQSAGVYRSTDDGDTWVTVNKGLEYASINAFETIDSTIYVAALNDVYRTTDRGETWVPSLTGLNDQLIYTIEAAGDMLFAGTSDGIYRSTNAAKSWDKMNNSLTGKWVQTLHVPDGSNIIIAGTTQRRTEETGLYRSTDGGLSWQHIKTDPPNQIIYDIESAGTDIYAATWTFIVRSTDKGVTWTRLPFPLTNTYLYDLESVGDNLFAVTWYDGIFVSTNRGNSWKNITGEFDHPYIIGAHAHNGYLFAGIDNRGVWRRKLSEMVVSTDEPPTATDASALSQNYPNPVSFQSTTTIPYTLTTPGHVTLTVYNTLGVCVTTLVERDMPPGSHSAVFTPGSLPPGVYMYRLTTGTETLERHLVVVE